MSASEKSVITCDLEGRIETFSDGAAEIFGWTPEEVIGRKRVSLFSPGLVVLGHVESWLKEAREKGEHRSRTVFVRKDGTPFAADIKITPTFKNKVQIGYCGVTVPLPDVKPAEAMPKISLATRIFAALVIIRAPFLTAALVPILIGAAWASRQLSPFPWTLFALTVVGGLSLHAAANVFNDYFDWKSGADVENNEYFLPFSGGSRSIELGLVTEKGLLKIGVAALAISTACGVGIFLERGPELLLFGLVGIFSAIFYTAPPLRLAARKGLGELFVGLNFGPLMVAGTVYALTGTLTWLDVALGLPIGLLTTAILWVNEFPDAPSDAKVGKNHLVVVLGKERARWGYALLLVAAFAILGALVALGKIPLLALLFLGGIPLAVIAARIVFRHFQDRALAKACATTIQLHLVAGLLLAIGLFVG